MNIITTTIVSFILFVFGIICSDENFTIRDAESDDAFTRFSNYYEDYDFLLDDEDMVKNMTIEDDLTSYNITSALLSLSGKRERDTYYYDEDINNDVDEIFINNTYDDTVAETTLLSDKKTVAVVYHQVHKKRGERYPTMPKSYIDDNLVEVDDDTDIIDHTNRTFFTYYGIFDDDDTEEMMGYASYYDDVIYAEAQAAFDQEEKNIFIDNIYLADQYQQYRISSDDDVDQPLCQEHLVIPHGVTSIRPYQYHSCTKMLTLMIPDSVVSIGENAFTDCTSLVSVSLENPDINLSYGSFANAYSLQCVKTNGGPDIITQVKRECWGACESISNNCWIDHSVEKIDDIFACRRSVFLPDNITSIPDGSFSGCSVLSSIHIPESVTAIGHRAFHSCSMLESFTVPENVVTIGDNVCTACYRLKSISLSQKLLSIGSFSFSYLSNELTQVVIPESVTFIDPFAFISNPGLRCLVSPVLNIKLFENLRVQQCLVLDLPEFPPCQKRVIIPYGYTEVPPSFYFQCPELESAVVPASVTRIGYDAFGGCDSLQSVSVTVAAMILVNDWTRAQEAYSAKCGGIMYTVSVKQPGALAFDAIESRSATLGYAQRRSVRVKTFSEIIQDTLAMISQIVPLTFTSNIFSVKVSNSTESNSSIATAAAAASSSNRPEADRAKGDFSNPFMFLRKDRGSAFSEMSTEDSIIISITTVTCKDGDLMIATARTTATAPPKPLEETLQTPQSSEATVSSEAKNRRHIRALSNKTQPASSHLRH